MNCIAASAPRKKTVGIPSVCSANQHRKDRIIPGSWQWVGSVSLLADGCQVQICLRSVDSQQVPCFQMLGNKHQGEGSEGVVGQAGGHEQEASQEDGRQCHGMDHPVTDARDDFEERAFTR